MHFIQVALMLLEILEFCKASHFIGLIEEINLSYNVYILFLMNYVEIITRIRIYFMNHTHIFNLYC